MAEQAAPGPHLGKRAWVLWRSLRRFFRTLGHLRIFLSTSYNEEIIPREGPSIVAAYHESLIDGIWLAAVLNRFPLFMAMAAIAKWPVVGWLAKKFQVVLVERGNKESTSAALQQAAAAIESGHMHVIYAPGKCVGQTESAIYKPGAAILAERTGAPVYLAASKGSGRVFPLLRDLPPRQFSRFAPVRCLEKTKIWTWLYGVRLRLFVWERVFPRERMFVIFDGPMYRHDYESVDDMTAAIAKRMEELRRQLP